MNEYDHADKRSVSTDALETLGMIHKHQEHRDAIHLGVEPVEAGQILAPGQDIYLENGIATATAVRGKKPVGIVDPFLKKNVKKGQRFWLVVYPRQITSLRHVWEHPDFPNSQETAVPEHQPTEEELHQAGLLLGDRKAVALQWIRDYADELSSDDDEEYYGGGTITADELIETAMSNLQTNGWGDYISKGGLLEGHSTSPEFWENLAIYKGIDIPEEKRNNFFSCSC